jgi:hypothetical protein
MPRRTNPGNWQGATKTRYILPRSILCWIAARDCRDDALIRSLRQAVFVPLPGLNHPETFMRTDLVFSHAVKFPLGLGASSRGDGSDEVMPSTRPAAVITPAVPLFAGPL